MNKDELNSLLEKIKIKTEEIKSNPLPARNLLVRAGIYNPEGALTANYR